MKKFIPTLIAIVLIIIIGAGVVGSQLMEKYSYSKEKQIIHTIFCPICFGYIGDSGKQYRQSETKGDKS